jgi:hypothetical protein
MVIIRFFGFYCSIGQLTHKAPTYATVISMMSLKNLNLAETIIDHAVEKLQSGLDEGILDLYFIIC